MISVSNADLLYLIIAFHSAVVLCQMLGFCTLDSALQVATMLSSCNFPLPTSVEHGVYNTHIGPSLKSLLYSSSINSVVFIFKSPMHSKI